MKRFILLLLCLSLSSCFDITEKIIHHDNQSGEYTITIDFSRSWLKAKTAICLEEVDGEKIPNEDEINQKLADFKRTASAIEGISNVTTSADFSDYIFIIKLNYANLNALNTVMNSVNKQTNRKYFNFDTLSGFERIAAYPIPKKLANDPKKKEDLQEANVISIYTFDKNVNAVTNNQSKISKNKKTVFLMQSAYNVFQNPTIMNNRIQFN